MRKIKETIQWKQRKDSHSGPLTTTETYFKRANSVDKPSYVNSHKNILSYLT